jgi:hypothetical protein
LCRPFDALVVFRYFNFGGVAPSATEESYMQTICGMTFIALDDQTQYSFDRLPIATTGVAAAAAIGNAPLYTGLLLFIRHLHTT